MLDAARYGDRVKGAEPPQELLDAWRVKRFGPPYDGGYMNWPAGMLRRMEAAVNVFNMFDTANSIPNKQFGNWVAQNPHIYRSLRALGDLVREHDATN